MDFLAETLQARREWNDIFKILKDKNFQPRILYPVKLSFRYDGEIKVFPDKQKQREFIATRPPLQEMIREAFIAEKKGKGLQSFDQEVNKQTKSENFSSISEQGSKYSIIT